MAMCARVVAVVVALAARAAATDVAVTMVDVNNTMSLADRIAALTCAGLLNRPEAVAAGVSPLKKNELSTLVCGGCSVARSRAPVHIVLPIGNKRRLPFVRLFARTAAFPC